MSRDRFSAQRKSARGVALSVLLDVDVDSAYGNIALSQRLRSARLSPQDAAFVTELVSGTLRQQGLYDAVIERVSSRAIAQLDPVTLNALRLGTHQLLELRTDPHAAVNESVELQRAFGKQSATGLVNAVLRKVAQSSKADWVKTLCGDASTTDQRLSLTYAHPEWIIRAFRDALTREGRADELEELLRVDNEAPKVQLALLSGDVQDAHVPASGSTHNRLVKRGPSPIGFQLESGSPSTFLSQEGSGNIFRVQDQGSQLAALTLIAAKPIEPGESWLDLCSGPGGKSAILAAAAGSHGAHLTSNEVSEHRADLVRAAVRPFAAHSRVVVADGTTDAAYGGEQFDRILVDAPCTGLGALRRRPEARNRKTLNDVPELTSLQYRLLTQALAHLKVGGVLAYVTCSPHLAETHACVSRALREHPEFEQLDAQTVMQSVAVEDLKFPGADFSAQLWPHRNGTDAMFTALITRRLET